MANKVELDRLDVIEEHLVGVRPLAQLVIEYQRYFVHQHAQRVKYTPLSSTLETLWPCCNVKSNTSTKGCQRVEYPFIETDKDFNDTTKWFHPGRLTTPYGWPCCNVTAFEAKGCEFAAFFDPTQFEHPAPFHDGGWLCCNRAMEENGCQRKGTLHRTSSDNRT